jgi:Immunity protein 26
MSSEPNLRALKSTRKAPRPGDLFRLSPQNGRYLFGRVISTDAVAGPMTGLNLIYIYRPERTDEEPPSFDELTVEDLLVPPIMTNRLPWTRGFFETIDHRDLLERDRLPVHTFRDSRGWFFDDHGNSLDRPVGPVGDRGVHSFRTIDDLVSDALGIPRAPD